MATRIQDIERRLWRAADELRANSKLSSQEYSVPVLGLIFLRYADHRFSEAEKELLAKANSGRRRGIGKHDYQALGIMYVPDEARFSKLLELPEGANIGQTINDAMRAIERENDDLKDVLPKTYNRLNNDVLISLLKNFNSVPMDIEGDAFGRIYEYFLAQFAMGEGKRGGEFFTPTSLVRLIVEIIEPYNGRIYDPACGSGGMFVQSARFIEEHLNHQVQGAGSEVQGTSKVPRTLSVYGQERVSQTIRLCQMNLAVHGLAGDVRQANSYYEDAHNAVGKFDFVMANPPFNVNNVDKEKLKGDPRFPLGLPRVDNGNYLWIQLFYSALNEKGRAGFVMANSAADARHTEQEIRRKLVESGDVDVIVSIGSNFFYTVTLPCTLWFLDKGKASGREEQVQGTSKVPRTSTEGPRTASVLFLDARSIFRQVSRSHRDFTPAQIEFLANIVQLYRGEEPEFHRAKENEGGTELPVLGELLSDGIYRDVPGLCKVATIKDIEDQGWSLNPGRYVGIAERTVDDFDFLDRLEQFNEELELLNREAEVLQTQISENIASFYYLENVK